MVEQYLRSRNIVFDGYVVSRQYYREQENTYQFEDIIGVEKIIIVTTDDYTVYQKLWECGMNYICLSDNIYNFLNEYISCM